MQSVRDILKKFNPIEDKYVSREFQTFGLHLATKIGDEKHTGLYMRLAKTIPRAILEEALRFVIDANARNKAALFMWKLKELKAFDHQVKTVKSLIGNRSGRSKTKQKKLQQIQLI